MADLCTGMRMSCDRAWDPIKTAPIQMSDDRLLEPSIAGVFCGANLRHHDGLDPVRWQARQIEAHAG